MIEIPRAANYWKNEERCNYDNPCVVCGKTVKIEGASIHTWEGFYAVTEDEVPHLNPAGESGFYPIGRDCLRKHPELKMYVQSSIPSEVV